VLPAVAAFALLVTTPALAQTTPPPSPAIVMPVSPAAPLVDDVLTPSIQRGTPPATTPPARPGLNPRSRPGQPGQPGQQGQQGQQGQGQQPTQAPQAVTPRPPNAPNIAGPNNQGMPAHTNIRLELTITDTFTGSPVKKTVTMIVLQNNGGMIRTTSADGWSNLNVDAVAAAYTSGLVSVRMTFEYTPPLGKEPTVSSRPPRLNESITVVLQDGKPLMVSQSADPATDRKVTADLTATILK
jgi:hypothetical protein